MAKTSSKVNIFDLEEEDYDTVLENDIEFSGSVKLQKPFMIKGVFSGDIYSESAVSIEEEAIVKADLKVDSLVIKGSLEGDVVADNVIRIFPKGKLLGNVISPEVVLDSGCYFTGNCKMTKELPCE